MVTVGASVRTPIIGASTFFVALPCKVDVDLEKVSLLPARESSAICHPHAGGKATPRKHLIHAPGDTEGLRASKVGGSEAKPRRPHGRRRQRPPCGCILPPVGATDRGPL